jgi:hypothetical protein
MILKSCLYNIDWSGGRGGDGNHAFDLRLGTRKKKIKHCLYFVDGMEVGFEPKTLPLFFWRALLGMPTINIMVMSTYIHVITYHRMILFVFTTV